MIRLTILFILFSTEIFSQVTVFKAPETRKYKPSEVVDPEAGIIIYDKLNTVLEGDSTRHDKNGYAANDWVMDYYESGQLLHKGYYQEGKVKNYKNYFPDGKLERDFRYTNFTDSKMQIFYPDGKLRSETIFEGSTVVKSIDNFPDGTPEFTEEYKKGQLLYRRFYFAPGKPESIIEAIEGKKNMYTKKEYHENGNLKEEGLLKFSKNLQDFRKEGKWKVYNSKGELSAEEEYVNGQQIN